MMLRQLAFLSVLCVSLPLTLLAQDEVRPEPTGAADPHPAAVARRPMDVPVGRSWWRPVPERGWLGVRLSTKPEVERAFASEELPEPWFKVVNLEWLVEKWDGEGAMVLEVFPETPAEKSGLLPGDVILSFNGIRTSSPGVLAFVVQRVIVGHDGDIEVLRDGEVRRVLVEVGLHPEDARRLDEEREAAQNAASEGSVAAP